LVKAYDADVGFFRDFLGRTLTDSNGDFVVTYDPSTYGPIEKQPDIYIEIWRGSSHVYTSRTTSDVKEDILDRGEIILSGKNFGLRGRVVDESGLPLPPTDQRCGNFLTKETAAAVRL
jgi:hypothetical protein